jgi:hypothetical protein
MDKDKERIEILETSLKKQRQMIQRLEASEKRIVELLFDIREDVKDIPTELLKQIDAEVSRHRGQEIPLVKSFDVVVAATDKTPIPRRNINRLRISITHSRYPTFEGIVASLRGFVVDSDGLEKPGRMVGLWDKLLELKKKDDAKLNELFIQAQARQNKIVEEMIARVVNHDYFDEVV